MLAGYFGCLLRAYFVQQRGEVRIYEVVLEEGLDLIINFQVARNQQLVLVFIPSVRKILAIGELEIEIFSKGFGQGKRLYIIWTDGALQIRNSCGLSHQPFYGSRVTGLWDLKFTSR